MSQASSIRKKIHVDLPADLHRRLRVKAALRSQSMQRFVCDLVAESVADVLIPESASGSESRRAPSGDAEGRGAATYVPPVGDDIWVRESLPLFGVEAPAAALSVPGLSHRAALQGAYASKLMVNDRLSRSLVSFQSDKTTPFYRWFRFKEAFSHDLVRYILDLAARCGSGGRRVLDPFAGAGTTLTTATREGWSATGVELLPVGIAAMRARLTADTVDIEAFESEAERILAAPLDGARETSYRFPHLPITRQAFPTENERALGEFMGMLPDIANSKVRYLMWFAALAVLEDISYTRKDGQYLRWDSRSGRRLKSSFDKGTVLSFKAALEQKLSIMRDDLAGRNGGSFSRHVEIIEGSCLQELALLPGDSFDLVVTSPPYCNRYDYTRTYALELAFMDYGERAVNQLRQQLLSATVENKSKRRVMEAWYAARGEQVRFETACAVFDNHSALQEVLGLLREARSRDELNNRNIPDMVPRGRAREVREREEVL
ncbi:MAG: site-specific DNA-methyltransferase [Armatimonadota bacterium]